MAWPSQEKNIYFANASEDPWQTAGMAHFQSEKQLDSFTLGFVDCADCGHCIDLSAPYKGQPDTLTRV